jgi:hypothetical protein
MKLIAIKNFPQSLFVCAYSAFLLVSCNSASEKEESNLKDKTEVIIPRIIVKNITLNNSAVIDGEIVYSVVKDVSFSKSGKLEIGDLPLIVGSHFEFNELLVNLNIEEAFKELAQSKLSFSKNIQSFEEQIEKKVPSELYKWKNFEADLTPSKRLPEFPTIYTELEKALIIEDDIYILFSKIKNQEGEIEQYFYLAPFDGIITGVFKKKNALIERNQTVIKIAKNDVFNAEFVVSKTDYEALKKPVNIDFLDKDNTKIGSGKIKKAVELNSEMKLICSFQKVNGKEIVNNQLIRISLPISKTKGCYLPKEAILSNQVIMLKNGKKNKIPISIINEKDDLVFVTGLKDGMIVLLR